MERDLIRKKIIMIINLEANGSFYNGKGDKISGIGPDNCIELSKIIANKAIIHDTKIQNNFVSFKITDRFYLISDSFLEIKWLPLDLVKEMIDLLKSGGKIGLLGNDKKSFDRIKWLLSHPDTAGLMLMEIKGNA